MKVPPKRKGNLLRMLSFPHAGSSLNESPSEKEGKSALAELAPEAAAALNESPSEKEGKLATGLAGAVSTYSPQ